MGNAGIDDYNDRFGTFEYWWTHGLISDSTYKTLQATCVGSSIVHPPIECTRALNTAAIEKGNIDPESIYTKPCNNSAGSSQKRRGRYVS